MEAFYRKNGNQAVQVNERLHWSMFQTPTRYILLSSMKGKEVIHILMRVMLK